MEKSSRRLTLLSVVGLVAAITVVVTATANGKQAGNIDAPEAEEFPPAVDDSAGITVTEVIPHSDRTLQITYDTLSVDEAATFEGMSVYVTVPESYLESPSDDFSTLYLLHGGGNGQAANWYQHGEVEEANSDLIMVMPEGGKVGWYTDWLEQDDVNQNWQTHHLDELIPFIDHNFRTMTDGDHRAIAGLSMGGFGALHYAQSRPDLFASVSSFSGALDTNDPAVRATVTQQAFHNDLPSFGAFGTPLFGQDTRWEEANPLFNADELADMQVNLYAGSGSEFNDIDFDGIGSNIVERVVGQTTDRMHGSLNDAGIEHQYWMYGAPVPDCDGGHNWACWRYAFSDALPRIEERLLN